MMLSARLSIHVETYVSQAQNDVFPEKGLTLGFQLIESRRAFI